LKLATNAFATNQVGLGALCTAVIGREDKGFQQFDWWRVKICPLGHYIKGHSANDNGFQNANTFCEFWPQGFVQWKKVC
jgi:hypothetical protein